jgi:hypothetical protein
MIARVADQTGLEFDDDYIKDHFWPCAACSLYRSNRGWLISGLLPFYRPIPEHVTKPVAGAERLINAKVHWSAMERLGKPSIVDEKLYLRYRPKNLPKHAETTEHTKTEARLIDLCRGGQNNKRGDACALHRKLPAQGGWLDRWRTRRLRQFQEEWAKD